MNKFEKVSYAQFEDAEWNSLKHEPGESCYPDYVFALQKFYENLNLPKRATKGSAGYDFFAPYSFDLEPGESVKIATGIRVQLDDDKFLALYPRSGLGFKFRIQLDNTVGVIDSDYYNSDNEGHIMAKITNDGREGRDITGSIDEYRTTPRWNNIVKQYENSGITPELTIQGTRTDKDSDFYEVSGSESVTVTGAVLTGDINLISLDTDGDVVKDSISFGAKNMSS